jgi:hypothetical protein
VLVLAEAVAAPIAHVEGRVGEDEVGLEVREAVVVESVAVDDLAFDAADGEVHPGEPPGRTVRLLAVNRDVRPRLAGIAVAAGVCADELHRLHEHLRGTAAGVVHPALVRLEHFNQQLHHAVWRVELAALLSLGARELGEEVLVDATQHVLRLGFRVADLDVGHEIDKLAEPLLVERGAGVIAGEHALERGVVALDAGHRVVYELTDRRLLGLHLELRPAGFGRHPENIQCAVLVRILGIGALRPLGLEPRVVLLEGVGDVLEGDQPEHDVLILGGIHAAA